MTMVKREKMMVLALKGSGCSRRVDDSVGNALEVTLKSSVIKDAGFHVNPAYGDHLIFHAGRDALFQ